MSDVWINFTSFTIVKIKSPIKFDEYKIDKLDNSNYFKILIISKL